MPTRFLFKALTSNCGTTHYLEMAEPRYDLLAVFSCLLADTRIL
jgi:hypothetical protein